MAKGFENGLDQIASPAFNAYSVTPSDSADLLHTARAIYCGGGGDVTLTTINGDTVTLIALVSGLFHPISASRIRATGTTATGIVAAY